jgi:acylphosphatase
MQSNDFARAEIIVGGAVQGVGFRYFVHKNAVKLGLKGYVKNLYSGEVLTEVEGEKYLIEEFFNNVRIGPSYAHVTKHKITWKEYRNEFERFEITF